MNTLFFRCGDRQDYLNLKRVSGVGNIVLSHWPQSPKSTGWNTIVCYTSNSAWNSAEEDLILMSDLYFPIREKISVVLNM